MSNNKLHDNGRLLQGVIFDMDGVLANSEEFICDAAIEMFAEHGIHAKPEDFLPWVGTGEDSYLGNVAKQYDFPIDLERDKKRTYDIHARLIVGRLQPLPGALEFVKRSRSEGFGTALATSADERKMNDVLSEIGIPLLDFDAVVHGQSVSRRKPHPDIFLEAAQRMQLDPGHCLVVEDSTSGLQAALNAGCRVLGLTTTNPREKMSGAHWLASNLADAPDEVLGW